MSETKHYFAGGNTPKGFVGYFESIIPPSEAEHIYCIKGGPGVGKSSFMKKIAREMSALGEPVSLFYCPSDPSSLDAVLIDNLKIAFLDGTAPHITDPKYPGACDTILDFGRFFDKERLKKNRSEIIALSDRVGQWFSDAKQKLRPVGVIFENVKLLYEQYENEKKLEALFIELSDKIFGCRRGEGAKERKLFLSAVTPDGCVNLANNTLKDKKLIVLNSFSGDASGKIMSYIRNEALCRGFFVECFYCPISPFLKVDHINIPELETAVTVSNSYHINELESEVYDIGEVYSGGIDKASVSKAMENADEIIEKTVFTLSNARELHGELEKYYIDSMAYDKLDIFAAKIVAELKSLIK